MDFVDGHIPLDRDSVKKGFGHAEDSLGKLKQICLVKFCGSPVIKERDGCRKLMFDVLADGFVCALGKVCDRIEAPDVVPVVKNVKMVGFVNFPVEFCVEDFIFTVIRKIDDLRESQVYAYHDQEDKEKAVLENSHIFSSVFT
jgi:hypothetical protein